MAADSENGNKAPAKETDGKAALEGSSTTISPVEIKTDASTPTVKSTPKTKQPAAKRRKRAAPTLKAVASKRKKAVSTAPPPLRILVIDNGGDTVKYGWVSKDSSVEGVTTSEYPIQMANITARLPQQWTVLVGDELDQIQNPSQIIATRSTERGIICNLGNQVQVWKRILDRLNVAVPTSTETAQAFGWKPASKTKGVPRNTTKAVDPATCAVLLLVAPHTPSLILEHMCNCWYNDFGFGHMGLKLSAVTAARPTSYETACVVDMGWSACQVVPLHKLTLLNDCTRKQKGNTSIRRLPLGGRQLQAAWKHYASYRQINLMDQDFVLRQIWEKAAHVSLDVKGDLKVGKCLQQGHRPYDAEFLLPDFNNTRVGTLQLPQAQRRQNDESANEASGRTQGAESSPQEGEEGDDDEPSDDEDESIEKRRARLVRLRKEEQRRRLEAEQEPQILQISSERFTIPESLFQPSILGLPSDWSGLAETIVEAISASPPEYHAALYRSIQIVGGLSQLPNIETRLMRELRRLVPTDYELDVDFAQQPVKQAWLGASQLVLSTEYTEWTVPKSEIGLSGKQSAESSTWSRFGL